ncbi:MAG: acetate kinase [Bacilli bacterium]|nr:acetate kinase [Bacilli bacterium]
MKVLSINAGSSSMKFTAYEMPEEKVLMSGYIERIGIGGSFYTLKYNGEKIEKKIEVNNHKQAFEIVVCELKNYHVVEELDEIKAMGHRVVQGGSYFDKSVIVTEDVMKKIEELSPLAPLHNPAALTGIKAALEVFPKALQVVVFDTAFHQTMKESKYLYGLPYEWNEKYNVRRFGAHGTSHKYVSMRANEILGTTNTKLITCHIGSGASISAVRNGICENTSMGLTPNAGLIMGTRCGDIDATIIPYMIRIGMSVDEIDTIMNKKSGLLGISGTASDARDIINGCEQGNKRAILARDMFVDRVVDYIAKYYFEMKGADAIIFTAGIGEKSIQFREQIMKRLDIIGIYLDKQANDDCFGKEGIISTKDSKIPCYVIPTDEEVMIARDAFNLL